MKIIIVIIFWAISPSPGVRLHWLEMLVGIQGVPLQWLASYLKDRTFSVSIGRFSSSSALLSCGV